MEFDYVIVGGGSAGCVLASRLSANPANQVLLLEAGGKNNSFLIQIPFMGVLTLPYWIKNWHYYTEPQPGLNNRRGYQPRGKGIGGSSSINAMIYIRGQKEDYNEWSQLTSNEWSYDSVLPLFKKFESNASIHDSYHGQDGELSVGNLVSPNPVSQVFIEAGKACGYDQNLDFNGATQNGVGYYQVTQKGGKRHSSADAFLTPVLSRTNLQVLDHTRVLKILFDGKKCIGVKVKKRGGIVDIKAKKKVILSAGAISSPHLLLLSGIGPREQLLRYGITCVHDLPGVGENFHDHPDYVHVYRSKHPDLMGFSASGSWDILKAFLEYKKTATGMMTTNFAEVGGFVSSEPNQSRPDIQLHFVPGIVDNHCHKMHFSRGMSLHVCALRPKSRGRISLKSASPFHPPAIDPNFFSDESDLQVMLRAYKIGAEIMNQDVFALYKGNEVYKANTEEEIIHLLRERTDTVYHPVGSCRMGTDEMAVVDPHLNVHGIEGLVVADASIMPQIVSGNTNAPTMMIAEQAAQFILN